MPVALENKAVRIGLFGVKLRIVFCAIKDWLLTPAKSSYWFILFCIIPTAASLVVKSLDSNEPTKSFCRFLPLLYSFEIADRLNSPPSFDCKYWSISTPPTVFFIKSIEADSAIGDIYSSASCKYFSTVVADPNIAWLVLLIPLTCFNKPLSPTIELNCCSSAVVVSKYGTNLFVITVSNALASICSWLIPLSANVFHISWTSDVLMLFIKPISCKVFLPKPPNSLWFLR